MKSPPLCIYVKLREEGDAAREFRNTAEYLEEFYDRFDVVPRTADIIQNLDEEGPSLVVSRREFHTGGSSKFNLLLWVSYQKEAAA